MCVCACVRVRACVRVCGHDFQFHHNRRPGPTRTLCASDNLLISSRIALISRVVC